MNSAENPVDSESVSILNMEIERGGEERERQRQRQEQRQGQRQTERGRETRVLQMIASLDSHVIPTANNEII